MMKRIVVVVAVAALVLVLVIPAASARTGNEKACFGQNTSFFVSQGVSLKGEATANSFPNPGAMLQYFHAELPFGCIGTG
jgi:hypothetical protein